MAETEKIYKGQYIEYKGIPHIVIDKVNSSQARGKGFRRIKLRSLADGETASVTVFSGDTVEEIDVDYVKYQFLYIDNGNYVFMNQESYEQIEISKKKIGDFIDYIKEGEDYLVIMSGDKPIGLKPPVKVEREIVETNPAVKGNTDGRALKDAKIEGGYKIKVPLFINQGDIVSINTETGEYSERVN